MVATDLPTEILAQIFKEIRLQKPTDTEQLGYCSLVCSSWRFPAQRELFSSFVVSSLSTSDTPNGLPYSIIAKDNAYSYVGSAIRTLRICLRSRLSKGQVDPDFHLFLQSLTAVKTVVFTNDSAKTLFNRGVFTPSMRTALRDLLQLPTLATIIIKTVGFPLATLSSCSRLQRLVLCSPTLGLPPNCDTWFDLRDEGQKNANVATKIHVSEIDLFGDSEFSGGLAVWLDNAKHGISAERTISATLKFHYDMPTQPGKTLFCNFHQLQHLRVHFKDLKLGHWAHPNLSVGIISIADIHSLVNLRSFQLDFPAMGQIDRNARQIIALLIICFTIPLLLNLPNPGLLNVLELYMMSPTGNSQNHPRLAWREGMAGEGFQFIWANIDVIVESRFTKLEHFAVYIPWLRHEEVLEAFEKCSRKGIMDRAPYYG